MTNVHLISRPLVRHKLTLMRRKDACSTNTIRLVCLLTCPEGIAGLQKAHPDVAVYTAAIDRQLNGHGYILPGLGDAGDRIFGTK